MGKVKTGETELTIGTIADGQYLKRVGTEIQSAAVSGGSGGGVVYDTQANRPAAGTQGREFIPTNGYGPTRQIDSGAAWLNFYNGFQCSNPPSAGTFTAINQTNSTLVADGDGLLLTVMGSGSTSQVMETYLVELPSAPYSFVVGLHILNLQPTNTVHIGTVLTNGATDTNDDCIVCGFIGNSDGVPDHVIQAWNNYNYSSQYNAMPPNKDWFAPLFVKIQDDNTDRIFSLSYDGRIFHHTFQHSRTTSITPTHCGFYVANQTSNVATNKHRAQAKIFHWSLG